MKSSRTLLALTVALSLSVSACAGGTDDAATSTPSTTDGPTATTSSGSATTSSSSTGGTSTPSTSAPTTSTAPGTSSSAPAGCVNRAAARLSPQQKAGQLIMVAFNAGFPLSTLDDEVKDQHIGNALFLAGWSGGRSEISRISGHLQSLATKENTGGVGFLVAADQEGGIVQQLKGSGFTTLPSAREQGRMTTPERKQLGRTIGKELAAAGVNVNLAPVADVVPPEHLGSNAPIGQVQREYGTTPEAVTTGVVDVLTGMQSQGPVGALKHFPGLGRVKNNTDHSASDITDDQMTLDDPLIQPFADAVTHDPGMVMMSSALYPKIDPDAPAVFSTAILQNLLRDKIGWKGVVITDDVNGQALDSYPVPERATRFIDAGGDIVLTGREPQAVQLAQAITAKAQNDPAFAKKVDASVQRVLTLKARMGLVKCG